MMVKQPILAVPQGCLRFVIVVFPDHTHLLFFQVYIPLCDKQEMQTRNLYLAFKYAFASDPDLQ